MGQSSPALSQGFELDCLDRWKRQFSERQTDWVSREALSVKPKHKDVTTRGPWLLGADRRRHCGVAVAACSSVLALAGRGRVSPFFKLCICVIVSYFILKGFK